MKRISLLTIVISCLLFAFGCSNQEEAANKNTPVKNEPSNHEVTSLSAFVGAGLKEPFEELKEMYEEETGITIETDYNSSGAHVSQLSTVKKGDIVIPGGMPFIDKLMEIDAIEHVESPIAYHVPVIVVPKDNPAGIQSFAHLAEPTTELIVPELEGTALGKTFDKILENSGIREDIEKQIIVQVETGPKVLATLLLGEGNAAITEHAAWSKHQDELTLIEIDAAINEVDDLPVAVLSFSEKKDAAKAFQQFVIEKGPAIFEKHGFQTIHPNEAD